MKDREINLTRKMVTIIRTFCLFIQLVKVHHLLTRIKNPIHLK